MLSQDGSYYEQWNVTVDRREITVMQITVGEECDIMITSFEAAFDGVGGDCGFVTIRFAHQYGGGFAEISRDSYGSIIRKKVVREPVMIGVEHVWRYNVAAFGGVIVYPFSADESPVIRKGETVGITLDYGHRVNGCGEFRYRYID